MKLFSILNNKKYKYYLPNKKTYSYFPFLILESNIQDLIWMQNVQLSVISPLQIQGKNELEFSGSDNMNIVNKNLNVQRNTSNEYLIGFGCLVFRRKNKYGGYHTGYRNLIDFDPHFLFSEIL